VSPTALDDAVESAAAAASPSVVLIQHPGGLGSGEVVDTRGYIVTNYHVLYGGGAGVGAGAPATFTVTLSNGASYPATVAGTDRPDDLALVTINAKNLRAIRFADSERAQVGQFVLAVGNPLGYAQTVTFGIISTLRRTLSEGGRPAVFIPDMLQTSAPINPGNSGGALVDLLGRLVGVPTLGAADPSQGTAAQGIGFAIPSNRVRFIAEQIIRQGRVVHSGRPYLGISGLRQVTPYVAAQFNLPAENGVLVGAVQAGGPAAKAGLRAGDIIVALNGQATASQEAFNDALARLRPGQRVSMGIARARGRQTLTVTLGELPVGD
jgi:S1-C subfamily serine protease